MKVELEIKDLNTILSALSIGLKFLGKQAFASFIGIELDPIIEEFFKIYDIANADESLQTAILKERFNDLQKLYYQLLKYEEKE